MLSYRKQGGKNCQAADDSKFIKKYSTNSTVDTINRRSIKADSINAFKERETNPKKLNDLSEGKSQAGWTGARETLARVHQVTRAKVSMSLFMISSN